MEGPLLGGMDERNCTPAVGIRLNTATEKAYGGHKYHAQALFAGCYHGDVVEWAKGVANDWRKCQGTSTPAVLSNR